MTKKIISMLCALAMVLMLAACATTPASSAAPTPTSSAEASSAEAEKKDPVKLVLWFQNSVGEQEYTKQVASKLNDLLAKIEGYEHITFELHPVKAMKTDFPLAQASQLQMDLVSTSALNMSTEIENGSFLAIDDYLAKYPEITAELPEWLVGLGKADGKTYFIPNQQQAANQFYFVAPKQYVEYSGYTVDQIRETLQKGTVDQKFEMFEKFVLNTRKETGKNTKWASAGLSGRKVYVNPSNELATISWDDVLYWDTNTQKIAYCNTNDDVVKSYTKSGEFYVKGYLHPDVATLDTKNFEDENFLNDESLVFKWAQDIGTDEFISNKLTNAYGMDIVAVSVSDHAFVPNSWGAGGVGVSSTCKNPEEAVAALALLENSKYAEFYNTLCYGLEGKHYEWVDKSANTIKTLEFDGSQGNAKCSYTCWKWTVGNTFNAWMNQSMNKELQDYIKNDINNGKDTEASPLIGLMFKTANVETEISQVAAVSKEYLSTLNNGIKGNDAAAYYEEYKKQLDAAGLNKILDELNKQASDFLASKK